MGSIGVGVRVRVGVGVRVGGRVGVRAMSACTLAAWAYESPCTASGGAAAHTHETSAGGSPTTRLSTAGSGGDALTARCSSSCT